MRSIGTNKTKESRKVIKGAGDTKFGNQIKQETTSRKVPMRKRQAATMMANPTAPKRK